MAEHFKHAMIADLPTFQYSIAKPDTMEKSVQDKQLRIKQMALRLSCFWLLELG
jgi:hypothetical protein